MTQHYLLSTVNCNASSYFYEHNCPDAQLNVVGKPHCYKAIQIKFAGSQQFVLKNQAGVYISVHFKKNCGAVMSICNI